jgi:hypothetical protein
MILSDKHFKEVKSLTEEKVAQLDQYVKVLKLDTNFWLYYGRTRLNDETGNTITCQLYGENVFVNGGLKYKYFTDK